MMGARLGALTGEAGLVGVDSARRAFPRRVALTGLEHGQVTREACRVDRGQLPRGPGRGRRRSKPSQGGGH